MNYPSPTATCRGCERLVSASRLERIEAGGPDGSWDLCLACLLELQRRVGRAQLAPLPIHRFAARMLADVPQTAQDARCETLARLVVRSAQRSLAALQGGEVRHG